MQTIVAIFNFGTVDHSHQGRVAFENIIGEGNNHNNGCWGCGEGETSKPFDERSKEVSWEMRGTKEKLCHSEKTSSVFQMENIAIQESI